MILILKNSIYIFSNCYIGHITEMITLTFEAASFSKPLIVLKTVSWFDYLDACMCLEI